MVPIHILLRFHVLKCTKETYDNLYTYCGIEQLTNPFNVVQTDAVYKLTSELDLSMNNTVKNILFIGDLLADRGPNDLFMFFFLSRLYLLQLSFEILISNHDYEFIRQAEDGFQLKGIGNRTLTAILDDTHRTVNNVNVTSTAHSLEVFMKMVNGSEPWQGVMKILALDIYHKVYKPALKLVSWRIISDKLILFTHAPIGPITIRQMNTYLNSYTLICKTITENTFRYNTYEEWCNSITIMNYNFQQFMKMTGWFNIIFTPHLDNYQLFMTNPFIKLIWNRNNIEQTGPKQWKLDTEVYDGAFKDGLNPQKLHFVHGHDGSEIPPCAKDYVVSLDHICGCGMRCYYPKADVNKLPVMLLL